MSIYTGPGRIGHCLQYTSDAHSALHRTLPKTKQIFGVGRILEYTPKSNSDTATAEHPRVFQAHINLTPFSALAVYILLTNKLNTPKYHGLGAIRVEGFHISNLCEAVQYRSNCGCLRGRLFDRLKTYLGCIAVLNTCQEYDEAMFKYPYRCLTAASLESSASTFEG
ncbi:hypothetical protein BDY19DRAFT_1051779 [Irpex rosettiformis]|uniref:Uncharacterized protein n=1 Tax=Irpex rosettiformis TaxID=378272 RepID=A0ACB8TNC4_9APHY|nr:hypothetical protein BDY19DRAFT_1051779 [Irpex rosettiformis]